jgi:hypothetical protein
MKICQYIYINPVIDFFCLYHLSLMRLSDSLWWLCVPESVYHLILNESKYSERRQSHINIFARCVEEKESLTHVIKFIKGYQFCQKMVKHKENRSWSAIFYVGCTYQISIGYLHPVRREVQNTYYCNSSRRRI